MTTQSIILPTNPADIKKIKEAVIEAANALVRADAEKEQVKAVVELINTEYEIPKQFVNRMVKTYYKSSFDKDVQVQDDFQSLYETVIR